MDRPCIAGATAALPKNEMTSMDHITMLLDTAEKFAHAIYENAQRIQFTSPQPTPTKGPVEAEADDCASMLITRIAAINGVLNEANKCLSKFV